MKVVDFPGAVGADKGNNFALSISSQIDTFQGLDVAVIGLDILSFKHRCLPPGRP
jgi:hypothetical protein